MTQTRSDKDFYETPESARYPLWGETITHGAAAHWTKILDLGCGDGRLARDAEAARSFRLAPDLANTWTEGVELDAGRAETASRGLDHVHAMSLTDVVPVHRTGDYRLVVSNPPFSAALEFLEYAMRFRPFADVLFLLPLGYLASQGRHSFWKANPPDALRVLSTRVSFTGDGHTANADYGWFSWGNALPRGIDFYP